MKKSIFTSIIKLTAVIILLQTLYFKFTAAQESVFIFSTLGLEPYGRIGSGIVELIASVLILIPRFSLIGAILGAGTMLSAILSHLIFLGIEVKNDGGTLFILALIVFICCNMIIFKNKEKIKNLLKQYI
jgi:uncharacterized membrane protein YphA (DoxX/SURF4 family)